jgi:hypothetical protein
MPGSLLEQEAAGSRLQRGVDELVEVERRQHQHACGRAGGDEAAGRLDAVDLGHPHVHEDDVRLGGRDDLDAPRAVTGLADDLEPGLGLHDHAQPGADHRLVVHQHQAQRHADVPSGT